VESVPFCLDRPHFQKQSKYSSGKTANASMMGAHSRIILDGTGGGAKKEPLYDHKFYTRSNANIHGICFKYVAEMYIINNKEALLRSV